LITKIKIKATRKAIVSKAQMIFLTGIKQNYSSHPYN
jgi:hypothetical protein